eukprot:504009-Prorocentrum_lima.AAC.1
MPGSIAAESWGTRSMVSTDSEDRPRDKRRRWIKLLSKLLEDDEGYGRERWLSCQGRRVYRVQVVLLN